MEYENHLLFYWIHLFEINIEITIEIAKPIVEKIIGHVIESEIPHIFDNWIPRKAPPAINKVNITGRMRKYRCILF